MGDALHYIDFHQLQIENKQYVCRIEERNDELLKVTVGLFSMLCKLVVSLSNARVEPYRSNRWMQFCDVLVSTFE